jgi:hypothetical protein
MSAKRPQRGRDRAAYVRNRTCSIASIPSHHTGGKTYRATMCREARSQNPRLVPRRASSRNQAARLDGATRQL